MPRKSHKISRNLTAALLLLSALALTACSPEKSSEAATISKVVIAMEPDKDPDAMLVDREALQAFVSEKTSIETEAIVPLSSAVITEGLKNGTIDIAYLSSTATARLMESNAIEILLANEIDGQPSYLSYWLALKQAPFNSVKDLEGKAIAFSSRTSTSGFLIPTWDLYKQGLITLESGPAGFFGEGNVHYGVGYVSAVERVLDGSALAAAVSYYVYEKDKHLSLEQRDRLKVIDTQGPVPSHVLVVRKSLSPETKDALREAFLSMNESGIELRDRLFGSALVEVDAETHLAVTMEALEVMQKMEL